MKQPRYRYLILGNGWIGNILSRFINMNGGVSDIWIGNIAKFYAMWPEIGEEYDIIVNTVAKTNIDWCEKNKVAAFDINTLLASQIAHICKNYKKKYVFFSSSCIFQSPGVQKPEDVNEKNTVIYTENSIPNPQCFYSETKVMAERLILDGVPNSLIIRPRLPISEVPHPRNTLTKLLSYDKLNTNQETITIIEDMLPVLVDLIENDVIGVVHIVNEGTISPVELGEALGHKYFKAVSKEEQDKRLEKEGRAKRVTTYAKSIRIPALPNIRERIKEIVEAYHRF